MDPAFPILEDDLLCLGVLTPDDAAEHLAGEDEELVRWLSGGAGTLAGVAAWIERNRDSWSAEGPVRNFGIWERATSRLVGNIEANTGWEALDGLREGDANIAYGLAPFGRGKGYAVRSVVLVCDFLRQLGVQRAVIRAEPDNHASHRVAERCSFTRAGEVRTRNGVLLVRWVRSLTPETE